MNLKQLNAFIHVANTGSMSQSAKDLGLSQPTLSRHIAQLEQLLGQALIDRYRRPMTLTPAGEFFYLHAQKSVGELNELIALTQNFGKSSNTLTIGFVASILYGLLPEIISKLKSILPSLDIKLIEVSSNDQIHALKSGEIDVGFGRFLLPDDFVKQIFLRHEPLAVALPIQHRLANSSSIPLRELIDETLILYHRKPMILGSGEHSDPLLHLFYERNPTPLHINKARDIQIALGLVSAGEGVTLVPKSLTTVRTEQIQYLPLSPDNITSPIYLNTLTNNTNPNLKTLLQATYAVYHDRQIEYTPADSIDKL